MKGSNVYCMTRDVQSVVKREWCGRRLGQEMWWRTKDAATTAAG